MACRRNYVSNIGGYLPLKIKQGKPFEMLLRMQYRLSGDPYPLAGKTAKAVIRRNGLSPTIVATFDAEVSVVDEGIWLRLTKEETAAIKCGEDIDDPLSQYEYECELIEDSDPTTVVYGDIQVSRDLIREMA